MEVTKRPHTFNLVPRVSLSPPPRALGGGEKETLGTRLSHILLAYHLLIDIVQLTWMYVITRKHVIHFGELSWFCV